jgi:dTDP-4-amino-4,6-dideoxygalactose transaminase
LQALKLLLRGGRDRDIETFRTALRKKFPRYSAHLFASGRESLLALLQSLQLTQGDEVIVQSYTCTVVANAISAAGATPVYADVDADTLNLSCESVQKVLTDRTKAVICQHTFGIPAPALWLKELCRSRHIFLIEDCAHLLPDDAGPKSVATEGDAVMLSFGRDKAISGVSGGAILVRDEALSGILRKKEASATTLGRFMELRLMLYPLLYTIARPIYGIGIGKALLVIAKKLGLLIPILTTKEKQGAMSASLHKIPAACAALAHKQLLKLDAINNHRRKLTKYYLKEALESDWNIPDAIEDHLPLLKFPLFSKNAEGIRRQLKAKNIHLDDGWTGCVLEAESILTLPTHPTMTLKQAMRLVLLLRPLLSKNA